MLGVAILAGTALGAHMDFTQKDPYAVATIGSYPGTANNITGTVAVQSSGGELSIFGYVGGLEPSTSGGVHIHAGCDTRKPATVQLVSPSPPVCTGVRLLSTLRASQLSQLHDPCVISSQLCLPDEARGLGLCRGGKLSAQSNSHLAAASAALPSRPPLCRFTCDDADKVKGHYWNPPDAPDPWLPITYATDANGAAAKSQRARSLTFNLRRSPAVTSSVACCGGWLDTRAHAAGCARCD